MHIVPALHGSQISGLKPRAAAYIRQPLRLFGQFDYAERWRSRVIADRGELFDPGVTLKN